MAGPSGNDDNVSIELKLATFNTRGLKRKIKRFTLLRTLKQANMDVICLQETHALNEFEQREIYLQWGGLMHHAPGSNRSKGLLTLFSPRFKESDIKEVFKSERILISSIKMDKELIFIVNVYAPCENGDKIEFLQFLSNTLSHYIDNEGLSKTICAGDFNIAVADLDIVLGLPHNKEIRNSLVNFLQRFNFTDCWRLLHPTEKAYTWSKSNPLSARRLDYVFAGESLCGAVHDSEIQTIGFSDHRLVVS